jgi:hypothetical protein
VVKDYLTSGQILDNRQDIIGQVSSFQASQPEEAAHGEEQQAAHQRRPTVYSGHPKVFLSGRGSNKLAPWAAGSPLGRQWRVATMKS